MTLPGECVNDTKAVCIDCGKELNIRVLSSTGGYYIGFFAPSVALTAERAIITKPESKRKQIWI